MKKNILIFLLLFCFLKTYSEVLDSVPLFQFKINPLLIISQLEFGGMLECRLKKGVALEMGGGVHVPNLGVDNDAGKGYTVRLGLRFYAKSGIYFTPLIFYRYMIYHTRTYKSISQTDFHEVSEPSHYRFNINNGGADRSWARTVSENKKVFSVALLVGRRVILFKKRSMEIYAGVGCRYKHKQEEIYRELRSFVITDYSPPKKDFIHGYVPSIQAGIEIPVFKIRKYLNDNGRSEGAPY